MQRGFPSHKVIGREKRVNPKKVITMKVTDKNMVDPAKPNFVSTHLHLGTFTAVYQKQPLMYI
jgi:hypothetical protein